MPLLKGVKNIPANVRELMDGEVGKSRQKAIKTLARKYNISEEEARFKQSLVIASQYGKQK